MENNWTELGFIGSIILFFYGMLAFIAFYIAPSALTPIGTIALTLLLGVLALIGGLLVNLGFNSFNVEYEVRYMWLLTPLGLFAWGLQFAAYIFLAQMFPFGFVLYGWATYALMILFLIWGFVFYSVRKYLGAKQQYALGLGILCLINGIGWISHFGFLVLALCSVLGIIVFASTSHLSKFAKILQLFTPERIMRIAKFGAFSLSIYSIFLFRHLTYYYLPIYVYAYQPELVIYSVPLNLLALLFGWLAVIGTAKVINLYQKKYENRFASYALLICIPALLILTVGDIVWLIGDLSYFIDTAWAFLLAQAVPYFLVWSALPNAIWTLLFAIALLQIYRSPETRGEPQFLLMHLIFLASAILWFFGYGYFPLILAGFILYRDIDKLKTKT